MKTGRSQGSLKLRITSTPLQWRRKQSIKESFVVGVASLRAMIISIGLLDRDYTRKTRRKHTLCTLLCCPLQDRRPEAYPLARRSIATATSRQAGQGL